jgi:molecular chaperone HtpG
VYQQLLNDTNTEHRDEQVKQLADLALLSQGLLSGEALTAFVNRSVKLMQ